MRKQSHSGFTLIELLVVLAVIAIISSISLGAFKSISEGNKRTSCQSNLSQIYKSVRLYGQDYDGRLPYLNENGDPKMKPTTIGAYGNVSETPRGGIGLWSLYTYPKPGFQRPAGLATTDSTNCSDPTAPLPGAEYFADLPGQFEDESQVSQGSVGLTGYVRSAKIFHCPSDNFKQDVQYRDLTDNPDYACKTTNVDSPTLLIKDGDYNYLNPAYLSYQVADDYPTIAIDPVVAAPPTYSSFRKPEVSSLKVRQITPYKEMGGTTQEVDRPTKDMTVLTWCRWHRALDEKGLTRSDKRAFDNVLFSDGSVQSLPAKQAVTQSQTGDAGACFGWQRVPREKADKMLIVGNAGNSYTCVPSP